jgi:HAD superfamily hydrolase (TIGR01662 family)
MTGNTLRVLLFDLGGTLMYEKDPWPPIYARAEQELRQALLAAGIDVQPDLYGGKSTFLDYYNAQRAGRSDPEEEISADLLKDLLARGGHPAVNDAALGTALRAMYAVTQSNWIPEHDALDTLAALKSKGYRLGLVSNATDDENTQRLIDKGGFRPYFEFILSSAACGVRKPDARIFQRALGHFEVKPSEAAIIGDSLEADVAGGQNMGMYTVWIARRSQDRRETIARIQPDLRVDSLAEIADQLNSQT